MNEIKPEDMAVKKVLHKTVTKPKVIKLSIVIPFYKQLDLCTSLITSIYEKSRYIDFELICINDDISNLSCDQFFSRIPRAKYFSTGANSGFGRAVNLGLQKASNDLVCIMHSDTVVTEQKMFFNLYEDLLSLRNQFVVTISASADNFMSKELAGFQLRESVTAPPVILDKPSPFICTMAYKSILLKAGGFPEYPFCWFEGDLLGHKLKKLGYKQAVSKRACVHHQGGATVLDLIKSNSSVKLTMTDNFKLFKRDLEILG